MPRNPPTIADQEGELPRPSRGLPYRVLEPFGATDTRWGGLPTDGLVDWVPGFALESLAKEHRVDRIRLRAKASNARNQQRPYENAKAGRIAWGKFSRGLDLNMDLIAFLRNYRTGDVLPDSGGLAGCPGQYKHVDILPRSVSIELRVGASRESF